MGSAASALQAAMLARWAGLTSLGLVSQSYEYLTITTAADGGQTVAEFAFARNPLEAKVGPGGERPAVKSESEAGE